MSSKGILYIFKVIALTFAISITIDRISFYLLNVLSDEVKTGQNIGKLNQYLLVNNDCDFLIFGSSRANHNIDPASISKKGFNMGIDGTKLAYSNTLIQLLPKKKKQTLLLHIDPENAFDIKYKGSDLKKLSSKYNRNNIVKKEMDRIEQNNIFQNIFYCLSYNGSFMAVLKNYFLPKYDYKIYNGFDPIHVTNNQREIFKNSLKKNNSAKCEKIFKINTLYKDYLIRIKEFCRINNKELILFTSPKYQDDCKYDNNTFAQLMKNKGITYFDMTDYFMNNNKTEFWKDKIHLSDKGAVIFTKKIKEQLSQVEK
jgi:hypothetical protein